MAAHAAAEIQHLRAFRQAKPAYHLLYLVPGPAEIPVSVYDQIVLSEALLIPFAHLTRLLPQSDYSQSFLYV
ncbi:hypothetical protein D3C75_1327190 [compost metagenome]